MEEVFSAIEPRLSAKANHELTQHFTSKEVTDALSSMLPLKSSDPDGFRVLFYKTIWHVNGPNVISSVLEFLNFRKLLCALNFTYIFLIPKVKNPSRMTNFFPISLCNDIYKIGSEIVANRFRNRAPFISFPIQSAFVPNQLITDNVLLAFELNHFIHSKPKSKVDYDLEIGCE